MKQQPSNLKFKKYHRPQYSFFFLKNQKFFFPKFGYFALKSLQAGKITFNEIESARRTIRRGIKKIGFIWINLFTSFSVTNKPVASRMGKGKGSHSHWICPVRQGQILFELSGLSADSSIKSLSKAGTKLSVRTRVIRLVY